MAAVSTLIAVSFYCVVTDSSVEVLFVCGILLNYRASLVAIFACLGMKFLTHVAFSVCIIFIITTENTLTVASNMCYTSHSKQYVLTS